MKLRLFQEELMSGWNALMSSTMKQWRDNHYHFLVGVLILVKEFVYLLYKI
ncbi:MAG: hypothetical protein ACK5RG_20765 [Cyclobacteriaceae bacterium]